MKIEEVREKILKRKFERWDKLISLVEKHGKEANAFAVVEDLSGLEFIDAFLLGWELAEFKKATGNSFPAELIGAASCLSSGLKYGDLAKMTAEKLEKISKELRAESPKEEESKDPSDVVVRFPKR